MITPLIYIHSSNLFLIFLAGTPPDCKRRNFLCYYTSCSDDGTFMNMHTF
ncbi:hypothetical protein FAEPRAM212_02934 [Faecalibacterium prausnitzii M21/2]|uniref:Uncharacterized protein n=1 Tax=Faecalibacterium prausnitzii M21/2 TaxID=411485 RepID=A8SG35_9FIRM|nr:hypothetical protein FAEPRAM212_02934 [Faecalibacterium prausnitzii M21/2]